MSQVNWTACYTRQETGFNYFQILLKNTAIFAGEASTSRTQYQTSTVKIKADVYV